MLLPSLREVPGGIEALADFFIPKAQSVIVSSQTMVGTVLELQQLSRALFDEYANLYQTSLVTASVPMISNAEHAGFDSLSGMNPEFLSFAPKLRKVETATYVRDLNMINGIEADQFLPILRKWIEMKFHVFQIMNRGKIKKPLIGFANPEIIFEREKELYARNIIARLEESLDSSNPFINSYTDVLDEIEKAIWHEMLFYATIISSDDLMGESFLPLNYEEGKGEIPYLPGEQKLTSAISLYRKKYFNQFMIHRKQTEKMQRIMG